MEAFWKMLDTQLMLFMLLGIGVITNKTRLMDAKSRAVLSDLALLVLLPCNILVSFVSQGNKEELLQMGEMLAVSIALQFLCFALNLFLFRRSDETRRPVLQYATLCSNATFLGNPVVESMYGSQGMVYASMYLLPMRVAIWSLGISYFAAKSKDTLKRVLTHPCIIATIVGLAMYVLGWQFPQIVQRTLSTVGSCTTAISMMVIGNILADSKMEGLFSKENMYFCFIRLIVMPLLVFGATYALGMSRLVISVAVVLTGMPAGTTTALLAEKYGGDAAFSSKIIFVSTILSLFTVPLWAWAIDVMPL